MSFATCVCHTLTASPSLLPYTRQLVPRMLIFLYNFVQSRRRNSLEKYQLNCDLCGEHIPTRGMHNLLDFHISISYGVFY